jgi:histidinol-phosphate aminotransferase
MTTLSFNPNISAAPIYVGGASIADIQKQYGLDDIIKLASNECPLGPSPRAVAAMQNAAGGLNRYPPMGDESLRNALAELHGLSPDNFVTGNGGCDVLDMLTTAFLPEGDECIICRPTFPVYDILARRKGANVVYVDLEPQNFSYDVEAMLGAVTDKTRLMYVCSPNNPTGSVMSAEQLDTLVNHLPPHVVLVFDEVYYHFADNHPNSLDYVRQGNNVVILHSFSKAYGLAGLRLGYGIAPAEIAQYLSRARQPFHLNTMIFEAGLAALADNDHLQKVIDLTVSGRAWLFEQLSHLEVQVWPAQGNFILFKPPFDPAEVSERLLQRGVISRPMTQFYLPTHLRVSVGQPAENETFIGALQAVLAELAAEGATAPGADEWGSGEFKF